MGYKRYDATSSCATEASTRFATNELILATTLFGLMFGLGWLVMRKGWNANYTRKILGCCMFGAAYATGYFWPYMATKPMILASIILSGICIAVLHPKLRTRSTFLQTAFASIDRPEDRPHTLSWFFTSYVVSSLIALWFIWIAAPHQPAIWMLVLTSVALGDIVSGAVGYRFGKIRYAVPSLATNRAYTRSLEGSLALFLTVLTLVFVFRSGLSPVHFWQFAIALPAAITLAEAFSPHTWDEPFMFLAAMLTTMAIIH